MRMLPGLSLSLSLSILPLAVRVLCRSDEFLASVDERLRRVQELLFGKHIGNGNISLERKFVGTTRPRVALPSGCLRVYYFGGGGGLGKAAW